MTLPFLWLLANFEEATRYLLSGEIVVKTVSRNFFWRDSFIL